MRSNNVSSGEMSQERFNEIDKEINEQRFPSKLRCLNSHKGLRAGEIHTLIGPKGGGKSSFVRTIKAELLMSEKKVYTFLSEEKKEYYVHPLYKCFNSILKDEDKTNYYLGNLFIDTQFDFTQDDLTVENFIARLEYMITMVGIEVFIFDNLTTSFVSNMIFHQQGKMISELKRISIKYGIAVLIVLHTAKGTDVYKDIIDGENVRGDATSVNLGSYNYIITAFFRCNPVRVFLTIDKARYHPGANKSVWELRYDKETGLFLEDIASGYHVMKGIITAIKKADRK